MEFIIISINLQKAFDELTTGAIIRMVECYKLPLHLRLALLRETIGKCTVAMHLSSVVSTPVTMECGLRQGGPDSAFLFAFIIAHVLEKLGNIWRQRGYGFFLRHFGGEDIAWQAWLDEFKDHILGFDPIIFIVPYLRSWMICTLLPPV